LKYVLHTPDAIFSARHTPSWVLLAGGSGMVNGLAFLACAEYVTHVTGTATRLGLEFPHAGVALEYAFVVVSFIAGAAASVLSIQNRAYRGKRPLWAAPLVVVAVIFTVVAVSGSAGVFGPLGGKAAEANPPFPLLWLLAFATGLQNAAVATSTGLIVRSTHLTGPATDLGVHLGLTCLARGEEHRAAVRGAALRGAKVIAFVTGAALALPLAAAMNFLAFLVPAAFVLAAAGLSFASARDREERATGRFVSSTDARSRTGLVSSDPRSIALSADDVRTRVSA